MNVINNKRTSKYGMYKDAMVQACLWSTLLYSISYPFIHLYIMKGITEKMFSANQFVICIFIVIINSIWNKHSDKLYKTFPILMITEIITYLILYLSIILGFVNIIIYYIIDTLLFGLITRNIICGGTKLKSVVYKGRSREQYDNIIPIVSAIASLVGSSIAFFIDLPMTIVWIISWFGIAVDNVFYIMAYIKFKNAIKEDIEKKDKDK